MAAQVLAQRRWHSLVKQNSAQTAVKRGSGRLCATRGMLEHYLYLLASDSREPGEELLDRRAAFEIFEKSAKRDPRAAEDPHSAKLRDVSLHSRAGRPIEHGAIVCPRDADVREPCARRMPDGALG